VDDCCKGSTYRIAAFAFEDFALYPAIGQQLRDWGWCGCLVGGCNSVLRSVKEVRSLLSLEFRNHGQGSYPLFDRGEQDRGILKPAQ
jgi:hypothetical protein